LAQTRARLQHAGEQLIEVRAAADERERGLVQDLEAALAESAAKVLEAEAASQAAEERERALQEEVEAVRADAAAQTCSLKTELEAARQAMMAVHTDAEDKAARLLAAESEMRDLEGQTKTLDAEIYSMREDHLRTQVGTALQPIAQCTDANSQAQGLADF
jgi:hypothetical protein